MKRSRNYWARELRNAAVLRHPSKTPLSMRDHQLMPATFQQLKCRNWKSARHLFFPKKLARDGMERRLVISRTQRNPHSGHSLFLPYQRVQGSHYTTVQGTKVSLNRLEGQGHLRTYWMVEQTQNQNPHSHSH